MHSLRESHSIIITVMHWFFFMWDIVFLSLSNEQQCWIGTFYGETVRFEHFLSYLKCIKVEGPRCRSVFRWRTPWSRHSWARDPYFMIINLRDGYGKMTADILVLNLTVFNSSKNQIRYQISHCWNFIVILDPVETCRESQDHYSWQVS